MKIINEIYNLATPYLERGVAISPIIHTDYVIYFAKQLSRAEQLEAKNHIILIISAILHDIGNCNCILPKIVESDVIREPSLKQGAIDCRIEHMVQGFKIANNILHSFRLNNTKLLSRNQHNEILRLVKNHDNYKLIKYDYKAPVYTDKLMLMLNEADILWMFTKEGIEKDIQRGSGFSPEEQLTHNYRIVNKKIQSKKGKKILHKLIKKLKEKSL